MLNTMWSLAVSEESQVSVKQEPDTLSPDQTTSQFTDLQNLVSSNTMISTNQSTVFG